MKQLREFMKVRNQIRFEKAKGTVLGSAFIGLSDKFDIDVTTQKDIVNSKDYKDILGLLISNVEVTEENKQALITNIVEVTEDDNESLGELTA